MRITGRCVESKRRLFTRRFLMHVHRHCSSRLVHGGNDAMHLYVILSCRKEVSPVVGFLFLGTIALAASLILFPVLLAAALPWLALFGRSISK